MIPLPKSVNIKELLNTIRGLAWEISEIFNSYDKDITKGGKFVNKLGIQNLDKGPVTNADLEVSELIKKRIMEKYPLAEWDFLSEEDNLMEDNKIHQNKWVWIIDPLDGTKDFINKTGQYAMHLALTYQKKVIIGIVLISNKEELWIHLQGEETWYENKMSLKIKPYKNSSKNLEDLTILTSKSHMHPKFKFLLDNLKPKKIIGMGSIGFKIASILRQEADLYISYPSPGGTSPKDWDFAAPASLIKGAGGFITDSKGNELQFLRNNFNQPDILIASIDSNHIEFCNKISEIIVN